MIKLRLMFSLKSDSRSVRDVRDNPEPDAVRNIEGDVTGQRREAAEKRDDNEVDDFEDRETDKALQWLGAEWESLAKILRQRDPKVFWDWLLPHPWLPSSRYNMAIL